MVTQNNETQTTDQIVGLLSIKCMKNNPTSEALQTPISNPSTKCQPGLREIKEIPTVKHVNRTSAISTAMYVAGEMILDDMSNIPREQISAFRVRRRRD
jgi:hypothetical protein